MAKPDRLQIEQAPRGDFANLDAISRQLEASREELEISQQRYADLYDFAPVGYLTLDRSGCIVEINLEGAQLLGQLRRNLIKAPLAGLIAPCDARKFLSHLHICRTRAKRISTTLRLKPRSQPDETIVELISMPYFAPDTGKLGFKSVLIDITEGKRAERAARTKESQLQLIANIAPVLLTQCSRDLRYLYVNRTYADYLNRTPDEIIGAPIVDILGKENYATIAPRLKEVLKGRRIGYEAELAWPATGRRFMRIAYTPDYGARGEVSGWVAVLVDLTERKQAENRLAASLEVTQVLAESPGLSDAILRVLRILAQRMGWEAATFWTRDDTNSALRCSNLWQESAELDYFTKASGRIAAPRGIGLPGRVWKTLKGAWLPEIARDQLFLRRKPAVACGIRSAVAFPVTAGNRFIGVMELVSRQAHEPDGALLKFFEAAGAQLGQFIERKRAEDSLRESEERFRTMADVAPVLIWIAGPDKQWTYFNRPWLKFTGRTLEQESRDGWTQGIHPQDRPRCLKIYSTAFDARQEFEMECRLRRRDGEYRWILNHGVPRFGAADDFLGYVGSCIDITDRKHTERAIWQAHEQLEDRVRSRTTQLARLNKALRAEIAERKQAELKQRESEERLRVLLEHTRDAVFMLDAEGRVTTWNAAAQRIHGYRPEEILGQPITRFYRRLDVRQALPQALLNHASKTGRAEMECPHVRKNGTRFWAGVSVTRVNDDSGRLQGFAKITRDISEKKRVEDALHESQARLQAIMDNSPAAVFIKDQRGRYIHFNRRFAELCRTRPHLILGKTDAQLFPARQAADFRRNDLKVALSGTPMAFDEETRSRTDRRVNLVVKYPLRNARGRIYAVGGIATDITERMRAQRQLRRSEEMLADFFENSPLGLLWVGTDGRIRRVNKAWLAIAGRTTEECLGHHIARFLADPKPAAALLLALRRGEVVKNYRVRQVRKDGSIRQVLIDADGLWEDGRMVHSRWFVRDTTLRVTLEQESLRVAERERRRIGHDLHDDLCQQLTGVEFLSQTLAGQLAKHSRPDAARAREIAKMIRDAITRAREIAHGLSPVQLETLGLTGALQEMAARIRKTFRVDCRCHCSKLPADHDPSSIHLYRIAQEAVANAIKHGRARRIDIRLTRNNGVLKLAVTDNGRGMPENLDAREGIGLNVMQQRAGAIGGTLAVLRNRKGGATVLCTVAKRPGMKSERNL